MEGCGLTSSGIHIIPATDEGNAAIVDEPTWDIRRGKRVFAYYASGRHHMDKEGLQAMLRWGRPTNRPAAAITTAADDICFDSDHGEGYESDDGTYWYTDKDG
jgi:hypothetical protein